MRRIRAKSIIIIVQILCLWISNTFANEKNELKLKLKPGQKHTMRINTNHLILQSMMEKKESIINRKIYEVLTEVKEVDANNIISIEITIKAIKEQTTFGDTTQGYDSTKTHAPDDNMANMYSAMIGESFELSVTNKGRITNLELQKMYLGMAENLMKSEDKLIREKNKEKAEEEIEELNKKYGSRENRKESIKKQIEQFPVFGRDHIMSVVENIFIPFYNEPVGIGDSWQSKIKLLSNLPVEVDATYTMKEINETAAMIDVNSDINLDNVLNPAGDQMLGPTKIIMKGSFSGSLQIDSSSGWLLNKKTTLKSRGEEVSSTNETTSEGIIMPLSIDSLTIVETIK